MKKEKIVDADYWGISANLARMMSVLDDGFRREGDVEELEKLLEESNKYIRRTIEKLREENRVPRAEASRDDIPEWLKKGLATCATATESAVLLRAYDELQDLGSSQR